MDKIPLKQQIIRIAEALNVFQVATITELATCLILSEGQLHRIINNFVPDVNSVEIPSRGGYARKIYFIGEYSDYIERLIIKKYKRVPYIGKRVG